MTTRTTSTFYTVMHERADSKAHHVCGRVELGGMGLTRKLMCVDF